MDFGNMTKEEQKKYQHEWYMKHREEVRARSKKYYEEHKEEQLAIQKVRYQENKDVIRARQKIYRDSHKEQIAETQKRYRDNGGYKRHHAKYKEKRNEYNREYHKEHREERLAYHKDFMKDYLNTKEGLAKQRINNYNREDRLHGRAKGDLTPEWFIEHIFNSSCTYCGDSDWKHLGADRIDNDKPHTQDNCICSCGVCNVERQCKSMSVSEFVEYRKNHPRGLDKLPSPEVVDVDGIKLIKKRVF